MFRGWFRPQAWAAGDAHVRELARELGVELFPAFEGYGAINDGPATILFRQAPPAGIAASPAARGAHRRIRTIVDSRVLNC